MNPGLTPGVGCIGVPLPNLLIGHSLGVHPEPDCMTAPSEVLDLVERFDRHRDAYRSGRYNETQLRREFLDPLFKALGWDVDNEKGYAEAYKDVVHEVASCNEYMPGAWLSAPAKTA